MVRRRTRTSASENESTDMAAKERRARVATTPMRRLCTIRAGAPRQFSPGVAGERIRLILVNADKWVNGTVLKYSFFEGQERFAKWTGSDALRSQVRKAFRRWADLGIGVGFDETADRAAAEVRIGFEEDDGHWSYVGREVLKQGQDDRTMNLDPTDRITGGDYGIDVAGHEIGHTLGFPHEHQNPIAGIVWDEEAVYSALSRPPNSWSRETTYDNIISKIAPDQVQGSTWDPNSIMHYSFEPGLILKPAKYHTSGIKPAGGLSARDRKWIRAFYPAANRAARDTLPLLEARRLALSPGPQRSFLLKPDATRNYELRTFGKSDTVLVLFERIANGKETYLGGDDDSGEERNAYIRRRLMAGRTYVIRLRVYYAAEASDTAVMWW